MVKKNLLYIVGGGSAGCVLASRLSEDPSVRVLLLEAGGSLPSIASIPTLSAFLQKTPYDWQFETVPQKNACLAMVNQVSRLKIIKLFLLVDFFLF
jgi:choline dehydrogenase-like flavoprotein